MKRLLLVGAIAVAGSLMLASAAAITIPSGGSVGAGAAAVTGFAVSGVVYDLDDVDPNLVDGVSFTIAPAATEVHVSVDAANTWYPCTPDSASTPDTDWTCALPDIAAAGITQLDIAAGS